jgi:ATP-dependent protease ClpP protease subunit
MKMEAVCISETSVYIYKITWGYIPEGCNLQLYLMFKLVKERIIMYNIVTSLFEFCMFAESSMERDKFMSPVDAKEFGIIDKILDHPPKHGENVESSEHCSVASN